MHTCSKLLGIAWSLALLLGLGAVAYADDPAPGWQTFRSDADGFSVAVPVDWVASAQTRVDGADVINLAAPDNTSGVMIVVQPSADATSANDLPNTRCQPITVGGQPATRCMDTLSFASSTISVQVSDRLYQIIGSELRLGPDVYQAMLASFGFDQAGASPVPAPPPPSGATTIGPTNPVQYDCGVATGGGRAKPLCAMP
jgi:hypothetical protein